MTLTDDERWRITQGRDAAYDGQFYVGVHSTGIYCRPSCRSRMPLRRNVRFYDTPAEAEAAGLRACKRCRPQEASADPAADIVARARHLLETQADQRVSLAALAAACGVSPFHLQRVFRARVGVSPAQYGRDLRADGFRRALRQAARVTDAVYEAGYGSSSRAYADSGALGMTPRAYQRGGAGETIRYSLLHTTLGTVLIAATARGLCRVMLGDDRAAMIDALHREFSAATLLPGDDTLSEAAAAICAYLEGVPLPSLPLEVHGTDFQRRVWQALAEIPYGERRTYQQIAQAIDAPGAVRAVGSACGANPVALIIPCHRVVRTGGDMGGYAWGLARKQALLEQETLRAAAPMLTLEAT